MGGPSALRAVRVRVVANLSLASEGTVRTVVEDSLYIRTADVEVAVAKGKRGEGRLPSF